MFFFNKLKDLEKKQILNKKEISATDNLSLIKEFDSKLDAILHQITQMKVILFELSDGRYNPFQDSLYERSNSIEHKLKHNTKINHNETHNEIKHISRKEEDYENKSSSGLLNKKERKDLIESIEEEHNKIVSEKNNKNHNMNSNHINTHTINNADKINPSLLFSENKEFYDFLKRLGEDTIIRRQVIDANTKNNIEHNHNYEEERNLDNKDKRINTEKNETFIFLDGFKAQNIKEIAEHLEKSDPSLFRLHSNKYVNDFASWVREVLKNESLAESLLKAETKEQTIEILKNNQTQ